MPEGLVDAHQMTSRARQAVLLMGIQAAGKSTFFKRYFVDTHIRLNLDMLRTRQRESVLLQACLTTQQSFVIDNTNPKITDRERYIPLAHAAGFVVIGYYFRSIAAESIERNAQRTGRARVSEKAIWGTAGRLELPAYAEGFDQLCYVQISPTGAFVVSAWDIDLARGDI